MRNLNEHPITYKEAQEFLDKLREEYIAEELVGDIRPTLVNWIQEELWRMEDLES